MGRPSKFKPEFTAIVYYLAKTGASEERIAFALGVTKTTIENWKREKEPFFCALIEGKAEVDDLAEGTLLKTALGYEYSEKEYQIITKGEGKTKKQKRELVKEIVKYAKPDYRSLALWLTIRKRAVWCQPKDEAPETNVTINLKPV